MPFYAITFLNQRQNPSHSQEQPKQKDWRSDPFIGLWQDGKDIQDNTQWVRTIRSAEWH